MLQHTATHCAAHCNAQQKTATYCNALSPSVGLQLQVRWCITLQHTARHCNTMPNTRHCNTMPDTLAVVWLAVTSGIRWCITLQHAVTHCNTLQHAAKKKRGGGIKIERRTRTYLCVYYAVQQPTLKKMHTSDSFSPSSSC